MESTFVKIAQVLLGQPPDTLKSADELIVNSFIKGIDSFSKINKIILAAKQKTLTPAKVEDVGGELSNIIFRVGCLVHLLQLDPSNFDEGNITEFSTEFDSIYKNDTILCSTMGIAAFTELVDSIYSEEESDSAIEGENSDPTVQSVSNSEEESEEEKDEASYEEYILASIIASCILLCDLLNIDFGNICFNSTLATKI